MYVDDMIVKAKENEEHIGTLRKFIERLREYRIRLNSKKCVFGVTTAKLSRFLITKSEIDVTT